MSPSVTAPPASSKLAPKRSLPRRPPDSDTTTDSSCTPAMLSAMSMAWRAISSASTRSTTEPAFMPLAAVWAKPRMRTPWLRRRSTSCGGRGWAAAAEHVLWRLRLEPRNHADDLAGADIETGDHGGALGRHRLHLGRKAE